MLPIILIPTIVAPFFCVLCCSNITKIGRIKFCVCIVSFDIYVFPMLLDVDSCANALDRGLHGLLCYYCVHAMDLMCFCDSVSYARVNSVLYNNHFSGAIPKEIGALTKLEVLDLRNNSLSGTIPAEIGRLKLLKHL